jgi:hypothetical protein
VFTATGLSSTASIGFKTTTLQLRLYNLQGLLLLHTIDK